MAIYIGTSEVDKLYLGTDKISEIYVGTDLAYKSGLYLIKDGVKQTTFTATGYFYDSSTGTRKDITPAQAQGADYLQVSISGKSGNHPGGIIFCTFPSGYKTLKIDYASGKNSYAVAFGILNRGSTNYVTSSWAYYTSGGAKCRVEHSYSTFSRCIESVSLENIYTTGNACVCIALCGGTSSSYYTAANIYNLWLE